MDFTQMVKIAMLLLQRREEISKLIDIVKEVGGALNPQALSTPTGTGSMAWLQESLNKLTDAKLKVDGIYGAATNEAVVKFQRQHGIEVDGWAGPETVAKITSLL